MQAAEDPGCYVRIDKEIEHVGASAIKMHSALDWLRHNKEWVFSGCGLAVASGLFVVLRWLVSRNSHLHRSHLQVQLSFGFLTYGSELGEQMLIFGVTNTGRDRTQIAGIKMPLNTGHNMFFPDLDGERRIPCFIEEGTSLRFWTELNGVESSLRAHGYSGKSSIRGVVTTGTGTKHKSNSVTFNI
jgi:hypothetical protein